ncbi:MAG TPA: S41 family peptidase [Vicinamibacterales bacterium]|nr:S41 family peptidase [Vicinamibacterales bacterium]
MTSRICLLIVALLLPQAAALTPSEWAINTPDGGAPTFTASGSVTHQAGAILSLGVLKPATPNSIVTISSRIPAETFRGRRVTIRGEMLTRGAGAASLWMRIDRQGGSLFLDNGLDRAVKGDSEWTPFATSLPVPASASIAIFGVILQGGGAVEVRALKFEIGAALTADAPVAPQAQAVLDAAIDLVKTKALKRDALDWATLGPELRALAGGAERSAEVYPAIRYLLAALGDRHSFLMPPAQTTAFRTGGAQNPRPEVRTLTGGIGYINVPAYGGADRAAADSYTTFVHESIATTMPTAGCGWIVDLRANGGGNMWPMLAGLKPFLGDEPLGTFVGAGGVAGPAWKAGQGGGIEPPARLSALTQAWVAVLTGPRTASSGEAVAIAFRGRPRARSFGQPTAGLSSANETLPLPDGAMIALTTAIDADRTGRQYGEKVDPDELAGAAQATPPAAPPAATLEEPATAAAVAWLKKSCGAM